MLVVIPTFNRIDRLRWTLLSLMQAELPEASERFLICLANNHPPCQIDVHNLVEEIKAQSEDSNKWQWYLPNREKALYPIENWYSAITSLANEDEIIFLHGDDDLFLPWGLSDRYTAIKQSGADMLLSESAHGLVFLKDKNLIYYPKPLPVRQKHLQIEQVEWRDIAGWGPAFIGNHCYRYTESFRQSLALSFKWCSQQDWLDFNTRTLMLPFYLPFAIKQAGGRLAGIKQTCVIRGTGLEETTKAPFRVPGWNPGFISLAAYGVLTNRDLGSNIELESARSCVSKMASEWFCTFFFDKRISPQMRNETLRRIQLPNFSVFSKPFLQSVQKVLLEKLRLRTLSLRNRMRKQGQLITAFLESIKHNG